MHKMCIQVINQKYLISALVKQLNIAFKNEILKQFLIKRGFHKSFELDITGGKKATFSFISFRFHINNSYFINLQRFF